MVIMIAPFVRYIRDSGTEEKTQRITLKFGEVAVENIEEEGLGLINHSGFHSDFDYEEA